MNTIFLFKLMKFLNNIIYTFFIFSLSFSSLKAEENSERIGIGEAGFLYEGSRPPYYEMKNHPFLSRGYFKRLQSDQNFNSVLLGKNSIVIIFPEKDLVKSKLEQGQFSIQYEKGTFSEMKLKKALMQSEIVEKYFFSIAQTPNTYKASQGGARAYAFSGERLDFKIKSKQKGRFFVEVQDLEGPSLAMLLRKFFFDRGKEIEIFPVWVGKDGFPVINEVKLKLYPGSALNALGYDPRKDFSDIFKLKYNKGRLKLIPSSSYLEQQFKNGIWVAIFDMELSIDAKKVKRQVQVRFSINEWNVELMPGTKVQQDSNGVNILLSIKSPKKASFRISANLVSVNNEAIAFAWQELVLSKGVNKVSLPVPYKYLTKDGNILSSVDDVIKDLAVKDIEIFSRALERYSTYRYYKE